MSGRAGVGVALLFDASEPAGTLRGDFSGDDTTVEARWFTDAELAAVRTVPLVEWALTVPGNAP